MANQFSEFGKLPPQAIELERVVLGAILIERECIHTVLGILAGSEVFYKPANQEIYTAILSLFKKGDPIDIKTVVFELRRVGKLEFCGGAYEITTLTGEVNSAANVEYHCRLLQQFYVKRCIIESCGRAITRGYDDTVDIFQLIDGVQKDLNKLVNGLSIKKEQTLESLLPIVFDEIDEAFGKGSITGVPSGFNTVDKITGGWQKSDLVIIAGRPGMGKTTFVLNAARNAVITFDRPVVFFSLEMNDRQLVKKMVATDSSRSTSELTKSKFQSREEIAQLRNETITSLSTPYFIIDDTPGINLNQIKAKCHKLKSEKNIQMVVVDYLQLIQGDTGGKAGIREQEISAISRGLKFLAKEIDVPVIALSQLSRAVETRGGDKRPQLSDLRESGSIEQDADMVIFLYRPEYYNVLQDDNGNSLIDRAEVLIAKHRNGKVCTGEEALLLGCQMKYSKFYDLEGEALVIPMSSNASLLRPSTQFDDDKPF
ncbi:MAG: replicative DNA helicase [Bacteroidota bacterium]